MNKNKKILIIISSILLSLVIIITHSFAGNNHNFSNQKMEMYLTEDNESNDGVGKEGIGAMPDLPELPAPPDEPAPPSSVPQPPSSVPPSHEIHNWNNGIVTKQPTVNSDGIKTYTCNTCELTKTETIPKLINDWDNGKIIKIATCEKTGIIEYTSRNTGEKRQETIPALGHNWSTSTIPANCEKDGKIVEVCKNDKTHTKERILKATGHIWDLGTITKEPTNTEEGIKTFKCQVCEKTKTESIPQLTTESHSHEGLNNWILVKDPNTSGFNSSSDFGTYQNKCDICGEVVGEKQVMNIDTGNGTTTQVTGTVNEEYSNQVFNMVNTERIKNGLPELKFNQANYELALARAFEISQSFTHVRPNGERIVDYLLGENIAIRHSDPNMVMEAWLASSGHSTNILRDSYKSMSVACVSVEINGRTYNCWVQLFSFYE